MYVSGVPRATASTRALSTRRRLAGSRAGPYRGECNGNNARFFAPRVSAAAPHRLWRRVSAPLATSRCPYSHPAPLHVMPHHNWHLVLCNLTCEGTCDRHENAALSAGSAFLRAGWPRSPAIPGALRRTGAGGGDCSLLARCGCHARGRVNGRRRAGHRGRRGCRRRPPQRAGGGVLRRAESARSAGHARHR